MVDRVGLVRAFDDGDVPGLSSWYDKDGKKVPAPSTADEAMTNQYAFLWSKKNLSRFLSDFSEVYLFGGSGNVFTMLDLFDKIYFLKIDPKLQLQRLRSPGRPTPLMDAGKDGIVIWGQWFEAQARERNIPFIDAALSPQEIFAAMRAG